MTSAHAFTSVITPEYAARRDELRDSFPAAHAFLVALEALCESGGRFHLGTAQNLHLYDGTSFLCYVRIERQGKGRPSLVWSPEPRQGQIKTGTQDVEGPEFARQLKQRIMDLKGFQDQWAKQRGIEFVVSADAPAALFDETLAALRARPSAAG
jgi:hypothetical protein